MATRLRIKLKSYDHRLVDQSAKAIVNVAKRSGARVRGPVPLPMEIHKYTVNRSPHVDKKSREQFEMRVHKRLIDILDPSQGTIEGLAKLALPPGVDVVVKTLT